MHMDIKGCSLCFFCRSYCHYQDKMSADGVCAPPHMVKFGCTALWLLHKTCPFTCTLHVYNLTYMWGNRGDFVSAFESVKIQDIFDEGPQRFHIFIGVTQLDIFMGTWGQFPAVFVLSTQVFKAKPWCFPNPNQIIFVHKPNQGV